MHCMSSISKIFWVQVVAALLVIWRTMPKSIVVASTRSTARGVEKKIEKVLVLHPNRWETWPKHGVAKGRVKTNATLHKAGRQRKEISQQGDEGGGERERTRERTRAKAGQRARERERDWGGGAKRSGKREGATEIERWTGKVRRHGAPKN